MVDISSLPYNRSGKNNTGKTIVYGSTGVLIPNTSIVAGQSKFTYVDRKDAVRSKYSPTGFSVKPWEYVNGKSVVATSANGKFVNKVTSTAIDPYGSCKPTDAQLANAKKRLKPPTAKPPSITTKQPEYSNPVDWSWNLPPHRWSMPLFRSYKEGTETVSNSETSPQSDLYRRGRIWWKMSDESLLFQTSGSDTTIRPNNKEDRKFGFQFIWNPEAFNTTVAVQMDVTPTAQDRFLGGAGFFPATQGITFNITLDRTNDFAAAGELFTKRQQDGTRVSNLTVPVTSNITAAQVQGLKKFYMHGGSTQTSSAAMDEKLIDLFTRGTIADLEFLYKAINGIGPSGSLDNQWINGRGIATADIGFLTPTLLNVDIGPLSYAGYVNNLSITHKYFTPDMVPIRTDVVISLQLLATAGLTDLQTGVTPDTRATEQRRDEAAANRGSVNT